ELRQEFGFKLKEILPYTSLSKSTFEYHPYPKKKLISDKALVSIIKMIKKHHASYGYWPVTDTLRASKYDSSKGPQNKKAKNRFHQKFKTDRPYQKVVTDISEFRYGNMTIRDRVYLSPFKDLFSGEIISYTITDRPLIRYVLEGLEGVFTARPKLLNYRMTIHSDQGIQYQSNPYRHALRKHKVFQSMSRRATCHDNAAMESFFHIMKVEMNYFTHHFDTKKQLVKAMKEWISYYNEDRIRHKLKGLTPIQYRN
ncbi:IS3 family transposase, partial [Lactobacillus sp. B4007]|uniref:IS3 family transposase n=1 Tax=Lactobacillus sp. B4007 TaxID=2818032 RepID=UPI00226A19BD